MGGWVGVRISVGSRDDPACNLQVAVLGLVLSQWSIINASEWRSEHVDEHHFYKHILSSRQNKLSGFCSYRVRNRTECEVTMVDASELTCPASLWENLQTTACPEYGTLLDAYTAWTTEYDVAAGVYPITLAPGLAFNIMYGDFKTMHIVPMHNRTELKQFLHDAPGKSQRRRINNTGTWIDAKLDVRRIHSTGVEIEAAYGAVPAEIVIDWVRTSGYLKNISEAAEAAVAFSTLFARAGLATAAELIAGVPKVNREALRMARVRVDILAMMIWRTYFSLMLQEDDYMVNFYLFTDCSPQRCGYEYMASVFDCFAEGAFYRRLLPNIEPIEMTALGKLFSLMWQVFLMFGPTFDRVDTFMTRVRSITTDSGTERHCGG